MKRSLLSALLISALLTTPAQAAREIPVQVDGTPLSAPSYVERGVSYIPLRSLLDAFGGWTVRWDAARQAAVASSKTHELEANPAQDTLTLNGQVYPAEVSVVRGRTYLPLRLLTETLGGTAEWDPYLGGAAVTSPSAPHDASDLYWLSRIISAESRGESPEGQLAVGNVVLNRVTSPDFPQTIPGVIFDRRNAIQFEPVANGTIYSAPSPVSVDAARRALNGERSIGDALYFYAPALSPGTWITQNRTYHTTIGCHRFYL